MAEAAPGNTLTVMVAPHWHMLLIVFFSMASGCIVAHFSHGGSFHAGIPNPHAGHHVHSASAAGKRIGAPLFVRRGGPLRNAAATYQHPYAPDNIAIVPKLKTLFPKKLVIVHPSDESPIATIAWLGSLTAGPFYMATAGDLIDAIGEHGCCAVLILESRRFF